MRRLSLLVGVLTFSLSAGAAIAAPRPTAEWPSAAKQLRQSQVEAGSALEALILNNQDFSMLRTEEAKDKIPVPLWLRVYWRKGHPETSYSAADPTGGYPHVLKEVYEWMVTHQELRPSSADEPRAPFLENDKDGDGLAVITAARSSVWMSMCTRPGPSSSRWMSSQNSWPCSAAPWYSGCRSNRDSGCPVAAPQNASSRS